MAKPGCFTRLPPVATGVPAGFAGVLAVDDLPAGVEGREMTAGSAVRTADAVVAVSEVPDLEAGVLGVGAP